MNAHRAPQMDRETVERLLDGPIVDAQVGPAALVQLLAALRAGPRPDELAGEVAAVRAFRAAVTNPTPARARVPERTGVLAGLLGLKAALAAAALAATGGVALAAVNGVIPNPLAPAPVTTPSSGPGSGPSTTPDGGTPSPAQTPGGQRTPSPALKELCRDYRAAEHPRKLLDDPAYAPLVEAAGGRERVSDWCGQLLGGKGGPAEKTPTAPKTQDTPDTPNVPSTPTDRPGGQMTTRPGGRPEVATTGKPETTATELAPSTGGPR